MEWITPILVAGVYGATVVFCVRGIITAVDRAFDRMHTRTPNAEELRAGAARVLDTLEKRLAAPSDLGSAVARLANGFADKYEGTELESQDKLPAELEQWIDGWQDDWARDGYRMRARELYSETKDWHIVEIMLKGDEKNAAD